MKIIPVINKIDLPHADPDRVKDQLFNLFDIDPDSCLLASAKAGIGIEDIFQAVISDIPAPDKHGADSILRFFLQDSWYDTYRGTVNLIQVTHGVLKIGSVVQSVFSGQTYTIKTLGILSPEEIPVQELQYGQMGKWYFSGDLCNIFKPFLCSI